MFKSHKNTLLLIVVLLSHFHILFREEIKVDWFVYTDKERALSFTIFMIGVFVRFIILNYCLLFPFNINKDLKVLLFTLSIFDLLHFFLFSGIGYEIEKIFLAAIFVCLTKFIRYVRFGYHIL